MPKHTLVSPERLRALDALLGRSPAATNRVPRRDPGEDPALSYAQQRMWVMEQVTPGTATYNVPLQLWLDGALDVDALRRALGEIAARHEPLRTRIVARDGAPVAVLDPPGAVALPIVDVSEFPDPAAAAAAHAQADAAAPFDLAVSPPLRAHLVRVHAARHLLLVTLHHSATDGWSTGVLARELSMLYEAFSNGAASPLPPLPVQYGDYAAWQRNAMAIQEFDASLAYWREHLAGVTALTIPGRGPRPAVSSHRGALAHARVPAPLVTALRAVSRREQATLFMTMLASFTALLSRYTGETDIAIGTPVAGRDRPELEPLIGCFVNTLVLRTAVEPSATFTALVRQTRRVCLDAYAHQDVPFDLLVDALQPVRDAERPPLTSVLFTFNNYRSTPMRLGTLRMSGGHRYGGTTKYDLSVSISEGEATLAATLEYDADLFAPEAMDALLAHWVHLLEQAVAHPDTPVADLDLLSAGERVQLLAMCHDAGAAETTPAVSCIERIARMARTKPDAIAVEDGDRFLTYRDLDSRSNRVAHHLRRLGASSETPVGICMRSSAEQIVAVVAALKAGAPYVPLDPEYPTERLRYMLEESETAWVLSTSDCRTSLPDAGPPVIVVDDAPAPVASDSAPSISPDAESLAYIIYTSGSMGRPKGVMVTRGGLENYLAWACDAYGLGGDYGSIMQSPLSFDLTVTSLLPPLMTGGRVVVVATGVEAIEGLHDRLATCRDFGLLKLTPAHLDALRERPLPRACARLAVVGGDALHAQTVADWQGRTGMRVINEYGPTETVVGCAIYEANGDETGPLPIGAPIARTRLYVIDRRGGLLPPGVPGEIAIGGAGVARGYVKAPRLTAERFVPDPFGPPGSRAYRSGDRGRWRRDGVLEYLGRSDHQVKLRGYRIELGEIERVLVAQPGVREAAALLVESAAGQPRLAAWVAGEGLDVDRLGDALRAALPAYSARCAISIVPCLPLTAHGKVDRAALAAQAGDLAPASAGVAPSSAAERALLEIWRSVLRVETLGITDNFFDAGGDSVLGLQMVARAAAAGWNITTRQIFQHQSIEELARVAERADQHEDAGDVEGWAPLTPIQQWFIDRQSPDAHHFNQAVLLSPGEAWDPARLATAVDDVLARHAVFRHRFPRTEDGGGQHLSAATPPPRVERIDGALTHDADWFSRQLDEVQTSLDLEHGPIVRAVWFDAGAPERDRLLFVAHHLVMDAVSWRLLFDDLQRVYQSLRDGRPVATPSPAMPFLTWARDLVRHARPGASSDTTNDRADDTSENTPSAANAPRLPRDGAASENVRGAASVLIDGLDAPETERLIRRGSAQALLLAALALALNEWTGEDGHLVDLEGHGRDTGVPGCDLSRTIGWFTTMMPISLRLDTSEPRVALERIRARLDDVQQRAWRHSIAASSGDGASFRWQVAQTRPPICFNYLGQFDQVFQADQPFRPAPENPGALESARAPRSHDLELSAAIAGGVLRVRWTYQPRTFFPATVARLSDLVLTQLRGLVKGAVSVEEPR